MAKNRMINTRFWNDTFVSNLDSLEKLLFLYFITNQYTNICGIYEIPLKQVALDTGIDRENIERVLLPRFEKANKIYYINGWIYIKNFLKHQKASGNVKLGIENGMKDVPKEILAKISLIGNTGGSEGGHSLKPKLELELELESKTNEQSSVIKYSLEDRRLAELLCKLIRDNTPTFKMPNFDKWSETIERMHRLDSRPYVEIEFVIRWCQKSEFWAANILSTSKLRVKFDTLVSQIKRDNNSNKGITII